jgi:hypothetical protein
VEWRENPSSITDQKRDMGTFSAIGADNTDKVSLWTFRHSNNYLF